MSTSPRDAGIPMLTEVIEEDITEFVGPPEPEPALFLAETPTATFSAYAPTFAAGDYAQPAAMGGQYGMPARAR